MRIEPSLPRLTVLLTALCAALPGVAAAGWQTLASETGRRIEIDRASIVSGEGGGSGNGAVSTISSRIVFERPIVDTRTSSPYRIIEIVERYDCGARTHATVKRSYYKEEGELLRAEEIKQPFDMPVRTGSPEDRVLREVCRPKPLKPSAEQATALAGKAGEAAVALRRENDALVARQVEKELAVATRKFSVRETPPAPVTVAAASAAPAASAAGAAPVVDAPAKPRRAAPSVRDAAPKVPAPWSYENADAWGRGRAEYANCANGRQQSPIDLAETIAVDLEPIQFAYRQAPFRVVDGVHGLQMSVYGGGIALLGKTYALSRIEFRRPAETAIGGKTFAMEAQLLHRSEDGKLAIVSVLLEPGAENPVIQVALNNLPLERGGEVTPLAQTIDVERLLPDDRRYYAFMGSLTTPPCTEEVLWLVLKKPQPVSAEQQAILARLYAPNARPLQPAFGRIIKEAR